MLALLELVVVCASVAALSGPQPRKVDCDQRQAATKSVYDFHISELSGQRIMNLSQYRGHVLLLVNVATYCRLTYTYKELNAVQEKFGTMNFTVIGFPCNQFGKQEPGKNLEILNGIRYVRPGNNFTPKFPLTKKIAVNGILEHPLYTYLKRRCPSPVSRFQPKDLLFYTPQDSNDVRWNFEKFLIGRNGIPLRRYEPDFLPLTMVRDIEEVIGRGNVAPKQPQFRHE
uniref:Glutathione peroxidase n=1 Tax=Rhipicephalus pulchellus TaxID=72859 RepID=L7M287_RHIPC